MSAGGDASGAGGRAIDTELTVRGDGLFRLLHRAVRRLDALVEASLAPRWNPFAQTGSLANLALLVACVTGALLLIWYVPSVHEAYGSLHDLAPRGLAGIVRSLHRYSSDAAVLLIALHALRYVIERKFVGPHWVAWVTGAVMVLFLWAVGWTGYWLLWDETAQQVATGTARAFDALPLFAEPLSMSFVVDRDVNSLLFFMVFFFHMLVPLLVGVGLWLHLSRLSRSRYLPVSTLSAWMLASLVALSLIAPAPLMGPARMQEIPQELVVDAWYLLPLALTDRLGAGALWALFFVLGAILFSIPRVMARRRAAIAQVDQAKCDACYNCYHDCPYEAVSMVPRTDGRDRPVTAAVDPSRCVGCGICAGSCNSAGIGLPWMPPNFVWHRVDRWLREATESGESAWILHVCTHALPRGAGPDPETGRVDGLDGFRVVEVPCAGWVHMLTVERALKGGAGGVIIAGCGDGACLHREGLAWTRERIAGRREPFLRSQKVDASRVHAIAATGSHGRSVFSQARSIRTGALRTSAPSRARTVSAGFALAVLLTAVTGAASFFRYSAPRFEGSELVVSFVHPGSQSEQCRERTPEELAALPLHMRNTRVCERRRLPVRLRVLLDGAVAVERTLQPTGVWGDGNSVALERISVTAGEHAVRVSISDGSATDTWVADAEQRISFTARSRRVVTFDRATGLAWH